MSSLISPMTSALCLYSSVFMRFAWHVQPRNILLFLARFVNHHYLHIIEDPALASMRLDKSVSERLAKMK
uniref:Mitochondrial pyruvate carrier n=1 Tax=Parascaris equorum TaxID=6256 RepID=A0A914RYD6_PAREQ